MLETDRPAPSFADLVRASARIGVLGFGGPAGQIALMHRIFVDEKRWIDEQRYLHALNFCTLLPGPEAQQLATYVGWLLRGVRGGVVAGLLFVAPGAAVVLALSWLYAALGETAPVAALFYGVKASVVALVAEALVRIGRRALRVWQDLAIAAASFVALAAFGAPFPVVILVAGLVGWWRGRDAPAIEAPAVSAPSARGAVVAAGLWGAVWLAPLALAWLALGPEHLLTRVGALFAIMATVTFGGAYAVLAFLQQQAVEVQGWLSVGQMIDGLGLAETTPGPLVLVNQFVGFMAGWNNGGGLAAAAAAAMASWMTFAPSFLFIFAGAPYAEALRRNPNARAALAGVTAAVLGVIANLALWFATHVLFAEVDGWRPAWSSFDPFALLLVLAAAIALVRLRMNVALVVAGCAVAGLLRLAFSG